MGGSKSEPRGRPASRGGEGQRNDAEREGKAGLCAQPLPVLSATLTVLAYRAPPSPPRVSAPLLDAEPRTLTVVAFDVESRRLGRSAALAAAPPLRPRADFAQDPMSSRAELAVQNSLKLSMQRPFGRKTEPMADRSLGVTFDDKRRRSPKRLCMNRSRP